MHYIFIDQWDIVTNLPTRKLGPGVAVLDDKIYVAGGEKNDSEDVEPMSSVDCYDPDTNTWSQVSNMNIARAGPILVSLQGRFYAIGGLGFRLSTVDSGKAGGGYDYVDSIEVYDADNNTWNLLEHKLDGRVSGIGAVAGLIKIVI